MMNTFEMRKNDVNLIVLETSKILQLYLCSNHHKKSKILKLCIKERITLTVLRMVSCHKDEFVNE